MISSYIIAIIYSFRYFILSILKLLIAYVFLFLPPVFIQEKGTKIKTNFDKNLSNNQLSLSRPCLVFSVPGLGFISEGGRGGHMQRENGMYVMVQGGTLGVHFVDFIFAQILF